MTLNTSIPLSAVPLDISKPLAIRRQNEIDTQNARIRGQQEEMNSLQLDQLRANLKNDEFKKGQQQYALTLFTMQDLMQKGDIDSVRTMAGQAKQGLEKAGQQSPKFEQFFQALESNPPAAMQIVERELATLRPLLPEIFTDIKDAQGNVVGQRNAQTNEISSTPNMSIQPAKTRERKVGDQIVTEEFVNGQWQQISTADRFNSNPSTVVNMGDSLTPFQKKVDENFAEQYLEWNSNGGPDAIKQIGQLSEALTTLESGQPVTGTAKNLLPASAQAFVNPDGVITREAVEEVVQRNLRLILGAQFTEKEGERLIARAYNQLLEPEENARRVRRLLGQMTSSANQIEDMARYVEQNGTLQGYQGDRPTIGDFYEALDPTEEKNTVGRFKVQVVE